MIKPMVVKFLQSIRLNPRKKMPVVFFVVLFLKKRLMLRKSSFFLEVYGFYVGLMCRLDEVLLIKKAPALESGFMLSENPHENLNNCGWFLSASNHFVPTTFIRDINKLTIRLQRGYSSDLLLFLEKMPSFSYAFSDTEPSGQNGLPLVLSPANWVSPPEFSLVVDEPERVVNWQEFLSRGILKEDVKDLEVYICRAGLKPLQKISLEIAVKVLEAPGYPIERLFYKNTPRNIYDILSVIFQGHMERSIPFDYFLWLEYLGFRFSLITEPGAFEKTARELLEYSFSGSHFWQESFSAELWKGKRYLRIASVDKKKIGEENVRLL